MKLLMYLHDYIEMSSIWISPLLLNCKRKCIAHRYLASENRNYSFSHYLPAKNLLRKTSRSPATVSN